MRNKPRIPRDFARAHPVTTRVMRFTLARRGRFEIGEMSLAVYGRDFAKIDSPRVKTAIRYSLGKIILRARRELTSMYGDKGWLYYCRRSMRWYARKGAR